jgi:hypothetical protein
MYKLEKQTYGLKLTLSGDIIEDEIVGLTEELNSLADSLSKPFSILVDAREMMTLDKSVIHLAVECQKVVKQIGRQYAAFLIKSPVLKSQGQWISANSGSSDVVRFIDVDKFDDWEKAALDWILEGIEPDPKIAVKK